MECSFISAGPQQDSPAVPSGYFARAIVIAHGKYAATQLYSRLMTFSTAVHPEINILGTIRLTGSEA
jgi:hypothetical protein